MTAQMKRRFFLGAGLAVAANSAVRVPFSNAALPTRVRPGMPGWPTTSEWAELRQATSGRLAPVTLPDLEASDAKKLLANPFYVGDQPGLTQSSGWQNAWRSRPSAYVVAAESAADIVAAVRFASAHNLRLVVKARGHSYLGASNAPDSLLVWTRKMDKISVHEAFTPTGSRGAPGPAVSVGAGGMWLHVYQAVTGGAGRYVQGGGCTTVGVAGLVQGGGFGSFSKGYGLAAASLIEAEVVTADGVIRIVNEHREPDLFWALKGGGGGTFGIVTRLTLATHPLPQTFGAVSLTLRARSDEAYHRLLARFIELYASALFNPHWGEQVRARPDNRLVVDMTFQGLTKEEARSAWTPLIDFANAATTDYEGQNSFSIAAVPAHYFWNGWLYRFLAPSVVSFDSRSSASWSDFWWQGDTDQVGAFWYAYTSAWMPALLLRSDSQARLVDAWFAASRQWAVSFHFNKGLGGAPLSVREAARNTPMNSDVLDAFALAIIASGGPPAFEAFPVANPGSADTNRSRVQAAMSALRTAAPDAGAYVNECDYFQPNWQKAFWGANYPRLLEIKRRYDPDNVFFVHHGVGSEDWSADGFTRLR
jgi:FAD/FMN-containing dehydrogenase